jgi:electron transport complex protein RnfC
LLFGKTFRGGTHPADEKELTAGLGIEDFPASDRAAVLMAQHIGAPCKPAVKKGDEVRTGQVIGEPQGFISAPIHSPVTGIVAGIEDRPSPVTGIRTPAVIIERTGEEVWAEGTNVESDPSALTPAEVRERVLAAGIVGMGGATFPTHVKLSPPADKPIDTAILNGAECEPYLNCDNRLMIEKPNEVVEGFRLILRALNCTRGIIALESNKPEAFAAMSKAAASDPQLTVEKLHVKYPQGAEHQLIKALLGREVPWHGGLPMAVGALVQNVATAYAVRDAVRFRRPLIERVLTVTGDGVERPGNFRVRVGTPVRLLLEKAGVRPGAKKLVFGGPMMGIAQRTSDIPTTKGTSGVLVLMTDTPATFGPCIRCGRCLSCPYGLTPAMFSRAVEAGNFDVAQEWNILECKECGCCAYVCPAKRPIVQQAKIAKAELARRKALEKARAAAK